MDTILLLRILYIALIAVDVIYGFILFISSIKYHSRRLVPVLLICIELCIYHITAGLFYLPSSIQKSDLSLVMVVSSFFSLLVNVSFLVYFSLQRHRTLVYALIYFAISLSYSAYLSFFAPEGTFLIDIINGRFNRYVLADNVWTLIYFLLNIGSFIFSVFVLHFDLRHGAKNKSAAIRALFIGSVFTGFVTLLVNIIDVSYPSNILAWTEPILFSGLMVALYMSEIYYYSSDISALWLLRLSRILAITTVIIVYIYLSSIIIDGIFVHNGVDLGNILYTNIVAIIILVILLPLLILILRKINNLLIGSTLDMDFIQHQIYRSCNKLFNSYAEMSSILKSFLNVSFCGFIIDGKLHSSPKTFLSSWYVQRILKLSNGKVTGIKQGLSGYIGVKNVFEVKELRNKNGILLGYIVVGRRIDTVVNSGDFKKRLKVLLPVITSIIGDSL